MGLVMELGFEGEIDEARDGVEVLLLVGVVVVVDEEPDATVLWPVLVSVLVPVLLLLVPVLELIAEVNVLDEDEEDEEEAEEGASELTEEEPDPEFTLTLAADPLWSPKE
jgi:hypothetical protein